MTEEESLGIINKIVGPKGFKAELMPGIRRVCVLGDARKYVPVFILTGPLVLPEVLAQMSTEITNHADAIAVWDISDLKEQITKAVD